MIEKPFTMVIDRSRWLLIYLILIHGLMLVMLAVLLPNIGLLFLAVIFLSTSFIYYCQCYQWLESHRAVIKIQRDNERRWMLFYSGNAVPEKFNLKHCVVTPKCVILYFSGGSFWDAPSITILVDASDSELFRQLRVYLRDPKTFLQ